MAQAQRGIRSDGAAAVDQVADSARRNIDVAGESAGADIEWFQEVLQEDFTGMDFEKHFSHAGQPGKDQKLAPTRPQLHAAISRYSTTLDGSGSDIPSSRSPSR